MPDPVRGTLTWDGRRNCHMIEYPIGGNTKRIVAPARELAVELKTPQSDPEEVDLELENDQPRRIRPVGARWQERGASPPSPSSKETARRQDGFRQSHNRPPDRAGSRGDHRTPPAAKAHFHNPYGFIRTRERGAISGELRDRRPESHSWFAPKLWSGRIGVKLTVKTPLLILDAAEVETNHESGHKTYPVRMAPDGKSPYLPPTSVKGMLRAAYEAVTNSRLGVFAGHDRRLGYRMSATEGLAMVPGRIVGDRVELLMGNNPGFPLITSNGRWQVPGNLMYAAWLPRYVARYGGLAHHATRYAGGALPEHLQEVHCHLRLYQHHRWNGRTNVADFQYWRVESISLSPLPGPVPPIAYAPKKRDSRPWHQPLTTTRANQFGRVCITNQNIGNKHDERVFFSATPAATIPLNPAWLTYWRDLVREYDDLHREQIKKRRVGPDVFIPPPAGKREGEAAFSRHIYAPLDRELTNGALVYVRYDETGKPTGLYPVMISRELHPEPPSALLHPSLQPPTKIGDLSPADRVFGWVRQQGVAVPAAYRGNLRVGPIQCDCSNAVHAFNTPLPLAILGQPKPNQARFYLISKDDKPLSGRAVRGAYDRKNHRVQGRKAYPHHAKLDPDHWNDAQMDNTSQPRANKTYQEYRRPEPPAEERALGKPDRDDQNRSVKGWIKPETVFTFDIHVTNLSDVELGALLWLLDLPVDGNRQRFHRLGGGKPLGFGSVRLKRTDSSLACGNELARYYTEFDLAPPPAADAARLKGAVEDFKRAVTNTYGGDGKPPFEKVPFIADFLVAAEGFRDQRPIHYPRVTAGPSPKGENFKWFQKNEQGERKGLAPLSSDTGLPFYTET